MARTTVKNKPKGLGVLLGKNIAKRRKAIGLTQAELAERIGTDTVTISRFERGSNLPSLLRLEQIANTLGLPLAELLSQSTSLCTDQSLLIHDWISGLPDADRKFLLDMLHAWSLRLKS